VSLSVGLCTGLSAVRSVAGAWDRLAADTTGRRDGTVGELDGLATLGAAGARIESAPSRTEAIMDLQLEEMAYRATLQALDRSLPDTLVSFLR
jgi:hypothetical protein